MLRVKSTPVPLPELKAKTIKLMHYNRLVSYFRKEKQSTETFIDISNSLVRTKILVELPYKSVPMTKFALC